MAETVKLSFDDGYKLIELNGDPDKVIRINPTDPGFLERIARFPEEVDRIEKEFGDIDISELAELSSTEAEEGTDLFEKVKKAAEIVPRLEKALRELVNSVFGYDISSIAFGTDSCYAMAGGRPIFMNFMSSILTWIEQASFAERELSEKKIGKYTAQAKKIQLRHPEELAIKTPPVDLSSLTPEQLEFLRSLTGGSK